ncbi:sulfate transporter family-domain-containing protein [Syncephalis fuscata]|nr:sulfate transporter family-domain-containing protein [Syncephalis fuscata]
MSQRLYRAIPILKWLPTYNWKRCGVSDVIAGLTLATIVIPQSMAYAMLAGLPPVYGLYASTIPVGIYACLGTSRHMNTGTFALTSLLLGQAVNQYLNGAHKAVNDVALLYVSVALTLSFLVGVAQCIMGMLRIGRFSDTLMPNAFISAFTTASAFHICTSQLSNLFGLSIPKEPRVIGELLYTWRYVIFHWWNIHLPTTVIGCTTLAIMLLLGRLEQYRKQRLQSNVSNSIGRQATEVTGLLSGEVTGQLRRVRQALTRIPIPDVLIAISGAIMLSSMLDWKSRYNIAVVGSVPTGLPPLASPIGITNLLAIRGLLWPAIMIACIGSVISLSIAKTFANEFIYSIDESQELVAIGLSSIGGAFFSCYLSCGSLTRSAVVASTGGKTQVTGLLSGGMVILTLLWLAPVFYSLPRTVLAAVILLACRGLLRQLNQVQVLWSSDRIAWYIWMTTFMAVFLLGVQWGAAIGVTISLILRQ